ncbi:hypothetical protein ACOSQ2_023257 [Xanthoceras sorbifolium]
MEEFIFDLTKCPDKFVQITDETSGEITLNFNDEYLNWKKIDQLLFDPVIATINAKKSEITLQEAQFMLMSFEARLEQLATHSIIELLAASANVLHRIHKGELPANFLREIKVFEVGSEVVVEIEVANSTSDLLCEKPEHFATICYYRYDQSTGNFGRQQGYSVLAQGNMVQQVEYPSDSTYQIQPTDMSAMIAATSTV